jgi:citrate lyase subunit beta/citryl-CoA lyase
MLEKAPGSGADALILDLEDSVPPAEKPQARARVRDFLGERGLPLYVRVNGFSREGTGSEWLQADLEEVVRKGLSGVILPKAESGEEIQELDRRLGSLEDRSGLPRGSVGIIPFIESARGVQRAYEVLTASKRVVSVCFGSAAEGDLVADLGCSWSPEGTELLYARSKVLLEARSAGIAHPLDGVFTNLEDEAGLIRDATNARRLGYRGKTVIHPRQIPPVNRVFSPSEEEISYWRELAAAFAEGEKRGLGAITFRGKMIDRATLRRAQDILSLAEAIEKRGP